jgi:GTP-binding protein HflX
VVIPKIRNRLYKIRSENIDEYNDNPTVNPEKESSDTLEIMGLCQTLKYDVKNVYFQNLQRPNPSFFIGRGKLDIIKSDISENNELEFAVFDCILKPNQVFNLESRLRIRVIDRSTLILMIFLHHSRSKEAKLQIEHAILNHQLPYIKELVRRTKLGEHPGLLAGGEYKVDEYFRLTRTRVKLITQHLSKIKISRTQQRKHRRKHGFVLISLAGYTNAGKSSLLRALTKAEVDVDTNMFSTVSPKTRRYRNSKLLFTDTVGFIQDIPTQLIEAFKSTLEEISDADQIILVADVSEPEITIENKLKTCLSTINQLLTERSSITFRKNPESHIVTPQIRFHLAFNKCDIEPKYAIKIANIMKHLNEELSIFDLKNIYKISSKTGEGLSNLVQNLKHD